MRIFSCAVYFFLAKIRAKLSTATKTVAEIVLDILAVQASADRPSVTIYDWAQCTAGRPPLRDGYYIVRLWRRGG